MGTWDGFVSLVPSEQDLADGWKKVASEPPTIIVPYQFLPGRDPKRLVHLLTDSQMGDIVGELKDGHRVPVAVTLFAPQGMNARSIVRMLGREVLAAILRSQEEVQQRSRMRVCLTHFSQEDFEKHPESPVVVDDFDGIHIPQVRFAFAPYEGRGELVGDLPAPQPEDLVESPDHMR